MSSLYLCLACLELGGVVVEVVNVRHVGGFDVMVVSDFANLVVHVPGVLL